MQTMFRHKDDIAVICKLSFGNLLVIFPGILDEVGVCRTARFISVDGSFTMLADNVLLFLCSPYRQYLAMQSHRSRMYSVRPFIDILFY